MRERRGFENGAAVCARSGVFCAYFYELFRLIMKCSERAAFIGKIAADIGYFRCGMWKNLRKVIKGNNDHVLRYLN